MQRGAIPEAEAEQPVSFPQFFITGFYACPTVYAGDVSFVFPRDHVHETSPVTAPAVSASGKPRNIHRQPQGEGTDPPEEHLHKPSGANKFTDHVPGQDRGNEHVN